MYMCTCIIDIVEEMDTMTRVQVLDEVVCLSHCVNTLRESMNPTTLPPAMRKIDGLTGLFSLGMVTGLGERKL